jgi:transposase
MRTIGIDLAVRGEHRAVVVDEHGQYVTAVLKFITTPAALDHLLVQARHTAPGFELQAVMEATAMSWFPIAAYLVRQGVRVYVVNCQQVADLRRYYKRHAKSDRIDARAIWHRPDRGTSAAGQPRPAASAAPGDRDSAVMPAGLPRAGSPE